jgi:hypothetical protein
MKDVVPLAAADHGASPVRAGSTCRQQECVGQLPNKALHRTTANCNSRSMVNVWSRTPVPSTITSRRR